MQGLQELSIVELLPRLALPLRLAVPSDDRLERDVRVAQRAPTPPQRSVGPAGVRRAGAASDAHPIGTPTNEGLCIHGLWMKPHSDPRYAPGRL